MCVCVSLLLLRFSGNFVEERNTKNPLPEESLFTQPPNCVANLRDFAKLSVIKLWAFVVAKKWILLFFS